MSTIAVKPSSSGLAGIDMLRVKVRGFLVGLGRMGLEGGCCYWRCTKLPVLDFKYGTWRACMQTSAII